MKQTENLNQTTNDILENESLNEQMLIFHENLKKLGFLYLEAEINKDNSLTEIQQKKKQAEKEFNAFSKGFNIYKYNFNEREMFEHIKKFYKIEIEFINTIEELEQFQILQKQKLEELEKKVEERINENKKELEIEKEKIEDNTTQQNIETNNPAENNSIEQKEEKIDSYQLNLDLDNIVINNDVDNDEIDKTPSIDINDEHIEHDNVTIEKTKENSKSTTKEKTRKKKNSKNRKKKNNKNQNKKTEEKEKNETSHLEGYNYCNWLDNLLHQFDINNYKSSEWRKQQDIIREYRYGLMEATTEEEKQKLQITAETKLKKLDEEVCKRVEEDQNENHLKKKQEKDLLIKINESLQNLNNEKQQKQIKLK